MGKRCQLWPPLNVNQTACSAGFSGTATPCRVPVMPTNRNPSAGPAVVAAP